MTKNWKDSNLFAEFYEKGLYPPKELVFYPGVKKLIENENFAGKTVLDFACGTGKISQMVKNKGAKVFGFDISRPMIEHAAKRVLVVQADGTEVPFRDNSFDYVFCLMIFMLIEDLEKAIDEVARVLKPDGKLFFGLIPPKVEKWDKKTGLCYHDDSTYENIEERIYIVHLTDGRKIIEKYIHRPLELYTKLLSKNFNLERLVEEPTPKELTKDKKYSEMEFLFGKAVIKN